MGRAFKQWALYQGDDLIDTGNTKEIAERRGVSTKSLLFLKRPSRIKRVAHCEGALALVEIDDNEED